MNLKRVLNALSTGLGDDMTYRTIDDDFKTKIKTVGQKVLYIKGSHACILKSLFSYQRPPITEMSDVTITKISKEDFEQ